MSECVRFWLDWSVQALVAIGTLGAVYAALFGDSFKAKRDKLSISIDNALGVYTPTRVPVMAGGAILRYEESEARFFQLRVRNASTYFQAHQVDVYLLRIDRLRDGLNEEIWKGEIPLIWQHRDYVPGPRTIGNPANADVFSISPGGLLALQPVIPALSLPMQYREPCELFLTVHARSTEGNSAELCVRVRWDGKWDREDLEMKRHIVFEVFNGQPKS
jgi:hypothetical protein